MAGLLCLVAAPAFAQSHVTAGQPFRVQFDGVTFADGYRSYVDGLKVGADLPAPATLPGIQMTIPAVPVGSHTVQVSAFNATGEGAKSDPLAFVADAPIPSVPTNLTIVATVAQDGSISLKLVAVNTEVTK